MTTVINIWLQDLQDISVRVHPGWEPGTTPETAKSLQIVPAAPDTAAMERRLTAYSNGARTREVIRDLRSRGCTLRAPEVRVSGKPPETYLRVYSPAEPDETILYLHPQGANFARPQDYHLVAELDGADARPATSPPYVHFDTTTDAGVRHVLAAVSKVIEASAT